MSELETIKQGLEKLVPVVPMHWRGTLSEMSAAVEALEAQAVEEVAPVVEEVTPEKAMADKVEVLMGGDLSGKEEIEAEGL